jgi:hypothetical protein
MSGDSWKQEFLYFYQYKNMKEAISAALVATGSQQRPPLKPKPGKGLHLRRGVLLIPPNGEIPCQGRVFSGKEIQ